MSVHLELAADNILLTSWLLLMKDHCRKVHFLSDLISCMILVGLNSFGNSVLGAITASVTQFLQIHPRLSVTRINREQRECERSKTTVPLLWLIFCRVRVVMSYCFMWLICKNNSPKKPFPFKLCFFSQTTKLWVQTWLSTPQTSYFQPEQNQI